MTIEDMISLLRNAGYCVDAPHRGTLEPLEKTVICGACGHDVYYVEFVPSYRHVKALKDGAIVVSGIAEDASDCAERAHLECMRCHATFTLPEHHTFE